jgi:hypothetical protein
MPSYLNLNWINLTFVPLLLWQHLVEHFHLCEVFGLSNLPSVYPLKLSTVCLPWRCEGKLHFRSPAKSPKTNPTLSSHYFNDGSTLMKRQDDAENRAIRFTAGNLQFPTQFRHLFLAFKHTDAHTRGFGGFERFKKFFADEFFAHTMAGILYFNYRAILLSSQPNPNLPIL